MTNSMFSYYKVLLFFFTLLMGAGDDTGELTGRRFLRPII
jgi:hypothetical protein